MAGDLRGECHQHQMAKGEVKLVAGSASWPLDLCAGTRATLRRAPVLGVMLCYQCLEILDNLNKVSLFSLHNGACKSAWASPVAKR